ncbi:hypothetical protein ACFQL4_15080 [Halosimplex aquaticum]
MTSVPRREAFRYGFYLFSYWLVLVAVCGALVAGGGWLLSEQVKNGSVSGNEDGALAAAGGFAAVLGVLVFGAGQTGIAYKLVADGAMAGVTRAVPTGPASEADGEAEDAAQDDADGDTVAAGAADTDGDPIQPSGAEDSRPERPDPEPRTPRESTARTGPPPRNDRRRRDRRPARTRRRQRDRPPTKRRRRRNRRRTMRPPQRAQWFAAEQRTNRRVTTRRRPMRPLPG